MKKTTTNNNKLKKNIIYNFLYQSLIVIIPFITSPYLARKLGAATSGEYSYGNTIAGYFVLFATLGINSYGCRIIAQSRDKEEKLSENFFSLYFVQLITFLIAISVYCIWCKLIPDCPQYYKIFIFLLLSGLLDITWFFQGIENFSNVVLKNTIIKLSSLVLIILFVKSKNDIGIYTFIMTFSSFVGQLILWPSLFKICKFKKVKFGTIKKHIIPVLLLFVPCLASSICSTIDKIMLGNIGLMSELGFYEYSEKIINIPKALLSSVGIAMLPHISNMTANNDNNKARELMSYSYYLLFPLIYAMCFGLAAIGYNFSVVYWGEEYYPCGSMLLILSCAFAFSAIANIFRTQYLIPNSKDKEYIISVFLASVFNIFLNFILIPKYGAIGACYSTVISELIILISQLYLVRKEINIKQEIIDSLPFLCNALIMFVVIYFLQKYISSKFISLICSVIVGGFVFLTLSFAVIKKSNSPKAIKILHLIERRKNK